jgi:hypothetical protein
MTKSFGIALAIGIGIIALAVTGVLFMQRGARVGLTGQILKIRTAPLDDTSAIMVADFRITNPSYVVFEVRTVKVILENPDGNQFEGQVVAEQDAQRLFEGLPILGQKFNETLRTRDTVPAGATMDRMVAARYAAPLAKIEGRKRFLIRIEDVDGATVELSEK